MSSTAIQQRDTRSPDLLASIVGLQRLALRGIAFDDNGDLLPVHGRPYVDYESAEVRA